MKHKLLVVVAALFFSIGAKAQNEKVDSLQKVLITQKEDTSKVNTLNALAYEFRNNDPDTAIYFSNKAMALSKKLDYKIGIGDAYLWMGRSLDNLGKQEDALKKYSDALKIYDQLLASEKTEKKSKILKQKAYTYNGLGLVYWKLSNYPEALKNHYASLKIRNEIGDKEGVAQSYNNIGLIYVNQGNYPEALKNYFSALKINENTGNKSTEANILSNIGNIYYKQDNYPAALKNHFAALKIAKEIGYNNAIEASYYIIGNIYKSNHDHSEALKNYHAALKIAEDINDKEVISAVYINIGDLYISEKNYTEAIKNLSASLKICEEIGSKKGSAEVFMLTGLVLFNQSNYTEALKNYFASLKIREQIGDKTDIPDSYINIGLIYTRQKKYQEASAYLNKGLSLAKEIGSISFITECYEGLATLDSSQGKFRQAFEHHKLYMNYRDSMFNEEKTKKTVQLQMQYDFDIKESATKAGQDKENALAAVEIKRQKSIKNAMFAGGSIIGIFSFLLVYSFNRRKKTSFEKQISVTEMKALRSQMNPHFIFNSLNSIHSFIQQHNSDKASHYLIKFSRLMRLILENSNFEEVALQSDLEALGLYMELEAARMNNKFSFSIDVNESIDMENTLIPPLILQPFVENSIWHGMLHKEGNGHIRIAISKNGDMIKCLVEDNGIGRVKATEMQSSSQRETHESLGMKITKERIDIINRVKKSKAFIALIDLYDEAKQPVGTLVEVQLPLEVGF